MTYGDYPSGQPPAPERSRLGTTAVVVSILAIVVVLGIVAGIVVLALRGGSIIGGGDPSPTPTVATQGATPGPPSTTPGPPVTAANLPTSGDLVWPKGSWHVDEPVAPEQTTPVAPCQTWPAAGPPIQTGRQGRSYSLSKGEAGTGGRAFAYVISYPSVADAQTAAEAIIADGLTCADRLQGSQGPQLEIDGPLGQGVITDVRWSDETGPRVGSWGLARSGDRLVWLWMEASGDGEGWWGEADGHPMAASLTKALRRLR